MIDKEYEVSLAGSFDPSTFTDPSEYLDTSNDDSSTMLYYGNLESGLAMRNGTTANGAFQQPVIPLIAKESYTLTLPVETFYPAYNCTIPHLAVTDPLAPLEDGSYAGNFILGIDIPPCPGVVVNHTLPAAYLIMPTVGLFGGRDGWPYPSYVRLDYVSFSCSDPSTTGNVSRPTTSDAVTDFFLLSEVVADGWVEAGLNASSVTGQVSRLSAVACKIDFQTEWSTIKSDPAARESNQAFYLDAPIGGALDSRGLNASLLQGITSRFIYDAAELPGVYYERQDVDYQMPSIFWDVGYDDGSADTPEESVATNNVTDSSRLFERQTTDVMGTGTDFHNLFQLFARAAGQENWTKTFEAEVLKEGAEKAINGIMSQWAAERLFNNASTSTTGELVYLENRLQIKPLALWFMVAGFLVMAICSVTLVALRPVPVLPGSPASITSFSMILESYAHLQEAIAASLSKRGSLRDASCTTWYRPFTCRLPFVCFMILVPLCIIGALEGLQHVSDDQDGFTGVSKLSFALEGWTHYLPAIVMVLIAVAYGAIDFNVSIFNAFTKLKRGARSCETIDQDLTMRIQVHALFTALSTRQWGSAMTTTAVLLASGLTVAVSGLYSIGNPDLHFEGQFQATTALDVMLYNGSTGDNGVSTALSLMDSLNLSFPRWTYDNLVIPKIAYNSDPVNFTDTKLDVRLPLYRPTLDCIFLPSENILASIASTPTLKFINMYSSLGVNITAIPILPEGCNASRSPNSTMTAPRFSQDSEDMTMLDEDTGTGTYVGYAALELNFFDYSQPDGSDRSVAFDDAWIGCPSHAFVFAAFSNSSATEAVNGLPDDLSGARSPIAVDGVKVLQCSQKIQIVNADVTFHLPDFDLNQVNPITVVGESSLSYLTIPGENGDGEIIDSFAIHFLSAMDEYYTLFDLPSSFQAIYRGFVGALRFGPDPITPSELMENSDGARSAFLKATNRLYSRYMAQFLNTNSRTTAPTSGSTTQTAAPPQLYNGTVSSHNQYRVIQHRGPKTALQVLLGLMVFCIALACWMVDTREVLVREPCSIAGKGSLLVGSRLLELANQSKESGAAFVDGRLKRSPFEGFLLRLSWWEDLGNWRATSSDGDDGHVNPEHGRSNTGSENETQTARWAIDIVRTL